MERNNAANSFFAGKIEHNAQRFGRTQFEIDVTCAGKKSHKQITPALDRQSIGAAFGRMTRGDNEWRGQALLFQLVKATDQSIQPKFEEIRRVCHFHREVQVRPGGDHADYSRTEFAYFDRCARCHILAVAEEAFRSSRGRCFS